MTSPILTEKERLIKKAAKDFSRTNTAGAITEYFEEFTSSLLRVVVGEKNKEIELARDSERNRLFAVMRSLGYDTKKVIELRKKWDEDVITSAIGDKDAV